MKFASKLVGMAFVLGMVSFIYADDDKKEVTIKGDITCAKCGLMMEGVTKCATVIKAKKDDKDVVYFFDAKAGKEHHSKICTDTKKGTVKGTVKEEKGKKVVTVAKDGVKFEGD